MAKSLEGYWEGEGTYPSNAIDEIVRKMEKVVNYPGDLRYVDTSDYHIERENPPLQGWDESEQKV